MNITKLTLRSFRNYTEESVEFSPNLNIIIGKNAQGKTNLLEAIFLMTIGRSPRTSKDKDMVKMGEKMAHISLNVNKKIGTKKIDMYLFNDRNKAIKIDDIGIKKIGQLLGTFNSIYFSPNELKLIKESPDERRKFMDIDLCQFDKNYFYNISTYNKILAQRNKLLKNPDNDTLRSTIAIWDEQLATSGAKIILDRLKFVGNLKSIARTIHSNLTSNEEKLDISYQGYTANSEDELKKLLLLKYNENLSKDIHLGYTTVGPHRDDLKIESNGIDLRSFGSQGQQRTAALSLKLSELEIFKNSVGEYPILLLDDVLSELDDSRKLKLLEYISPMQTLLTCTEFDFNIPHTKIKIESGQVVSND